MLKVVTLELLDRGIQVVIYGCSGSVILVCNWGVVRSAVGDSDRGADRLGPCIASSPMAPQKAAVLSRCI
jgi:hypothetical protein